MRARNILFFLLITSFCSCGHVYSSHFQVEKNPDPEMKTIAVLPLENLTNSPEAGRVITELLVTELHNVGRYEVLGQVEMTKIFKDQDVRLPKFSDRVVATEIGRRLGADGVFIGSVSEFRYRKDFDPEVEEEEPVVGINLRLVNVHSSTVIWGGSHSRSSYEVFTYEKDPLTRVAIRAIKEMLGTLQ